MRKSELRILKNLKDEAMTPDKLAEAIEKSRSWTSELISQLKEEGLVEKNDKIAFAGTYKASLLGNLIGDYDIEKLLTGEKEEILKRLNSKPRSISKLEKKGFAKTTLYEAIKDLKETGTVKKEEGVYRIVDEKLSNFFKTQEKKPFQKIHRADGEKVIETTREKAKGTATAFSRFQDHGLDYYPVDYYSYQGEVEIDPENVLIHAILCAENKKQMAMCGIFYLTHRSNLESSELYRLSVKWDCEERWKDLLAYLDQRKVKNGQLFLSWKEFTQLAEEYNMYLRRKYLEKSLLSAFDQIGKELEDPTNIHLLGGANLILRGLKDSTKDIDIVLKNKEAFQNLVEILKKQGYEERMELKGEYEKLAPRSVLEKEGSPRWDIFVEKIANALHFTDEMKKRSESAEKFGFLNLNLISLTDVLLFKSITEREGDLEDTALIARRSSVDWQALFQEIKIQEEITGRYFSFAVLDTLKFLENTHDIVIPIQNKLVSYCLENALLLSLEEPKTIEDLRDELDFPDHQIYNKLRKLEEEGKIKVDRNGKLNEYFL